jgi:hypothetical protein
LKGSFNWKNRSLALFAQSGLRLSYPTRNGPGENGIKELLSWMTQRDTSLSYIRKSKRIFATCKLTQISWHSSWYARTVPQNSLESEVLGGQAKTIMRLGGTCADHKRWPLCRTQVKHGNQGISINITPGASRVFFNRHNCIICLTNGLTFVVFCAP